MGTGCFPFHIKGLVKRAKLQGPLRIDLICVLLHQGDTIGWCLTCAYKTSKWSWARCTRLRLPALRAKEGTYFLWTRGGLTVRESWSDHLKCSLRGFPGGPGTYRVPVRWAAVRRVTGWQEHMTKSWEMHSNESSGVGVGTWVEAWNRLVSNPHQIKKELRYQELYKEPFPIPDMTFMFP